LPSLSLGLLTQTLLTLLIPTEPDKDTVGPGSPDLSIRCLLFIIYTSLTFFNVVELKVSQSDN